MTSASYLLIAIGVLGALDIAIYHTWQQQLRTRASARRELITHALRGPTYALLFLVVPNVSVEGLYAGLVLGLLVFDAGISFADFALEKESRQPMGGLPTGEYLLHSAIAILFGAMAACLVSRLGPGLAKPTAFRVDPAVPDAVRALLGLMACGVFASGLQDALAVRRLSAAAPGACAARAVRTRETS